MADVYGSAVGNAWRCHVKVWMSEQDDYACTYICETYIQSLGTASYTVNAEGYAILTDPSGYVSGSDSGSFTATAGVSTEQRIATVTSVVYRGEKAKTVTMDGSYITVASSKYPGTSTPKAVTLTVPAIQHKTPRDVKNLKMESYEDSEYGKDPAYEWTLKWENDADSMATDIQPYSGIRIYRTENGGSKKLLAELSADTTEYTVNDSGYGHAYVFTVRPYNDAGEATGQSTWTAYMDPPQITGITCERLDDLSNMRLNFDGIWYATSYRFLWITDDSRGYITPSWDGTGWLWEQGTLASQDLTVRVQAIYHDPHYDYDHYGQWSDPVEIKAQGTAPNAPTVNALSTVYATNSKIALKWAANHPDYAGINYTSLQITTKNGTETVTVQGGATSYDYTASVKGTVTISVTTYTNAGAGPSPATSRTFTVADAPVVSFTSPAKDGDEVHGLPLVLKWSVTDETGVSAQTLAVTKTAGGNVCSATPATSDRQHSFGTDSGIKNSTSYTASLTVTGGSGLLTTAKRVFQARWTGPDAPTVTTATDTDNYRVTVTSTAATTGDVATKSLTVTREWSDGTGTHKETLATGLKSGAKTVDKLPPLGTPIAYTVTAVAETGATTSTVKTVTVSAGGYEVYNFGNDASIGLALGLSASSSESIELTGETFDLAGAAGEGGLMAFYADGGMTGSGTHSYNVLRETEYERARSLSRQYPVAWYRDAWGGVQRCHVKFSFSYDADSYSLWGISVSTDEIEWKDPK